MGKSNKYSVALAALLSDIGKSNLKPAAGVQNTVEEAMAFFDAAFNGQSKVIALRDEIRQLLENKENPILRLTANASEHEAGARGNDRKVQSKPLFSVLSLVETGRPLPKGESYYLPGTSSITDCYPRSAGLPTVDELQAASDSVYQNLLNDIHSIQDSEPEQLIETLLFLFEKHLSYTPSARYLSKPDISLFDHLKSTAALAACYNETDNEEKPFLIVAADVSGIQNFIYSETNPIENIQKGRSKQFRGKSFYLSLLTDTFSSYLLREAGVSSANLLINGGGHFILVLPNSGNIRKKMDEARKKIQTWFYKTYRGELNLILETLEVDEELYQNFPKWHGKIANKLTAAKKQRSIQFLPDIFKLNLDTAPVQYIASPNKEDEDREDWERLNGYEKFLYSLTVMFQEIGAVIPKAKFILRKDTPADRKPAYNRNQSCAEIAFPAFGITWLIASSVKDVNKWLENNPGGNTSVYSVNSFELTGGLNVAEEEAARMAFGTKLIGKYAPAVQGGDSVLEFPALAELNTEGEKKLGYPLLAVLRMDVDNLGAVFSFGLERENDSESIRSLSRTVNLSRLLNLFFTGYINQLAEKRKIYITYSGGDDLFVVGSWINAVEFAFEVREAFNKFSGGNSNLSVSAGMYLCKENYPIHKAAAHAGSAETSAKNSSPDKDSISLFGKEMKWSRAKELLNYGKAIDSLVETNNEDEKISASYVHFLLSQTSKMLNDDKKIDLEKYFKGMFKIKYSLARKPRNIDYKAIQEDSNKTKPNKKVELFGRLINSEKSTELIQDFVVPASYVIFKNRTTK